MSSAASKYGTTTTLVNVRRLNGLPDGQARAFGRIDRTSSLELGDLITVYIPISSSASAGTYEFYAVRSLDGARWTDDIDASASVANVADHLNDAVLIKVVNASGGGGNTAASVFIDTRDFESDPSPYIGFVMKNESNVAVPVTANATATGSYRAYTVEMLGS